MLLTTLTKWFLTFSSFVHSQRPTFELEVQAWKGAFVPLFLLCSEEMSDLRSTTHPAYRRPRREAAMDIWQVFCGRPKATAAIYRTTGHVRTIWRYPRNRKTIGERLATPGAFQEPCCSFLGALSCGTRDKPYPTMSPNQSWSNVENKMHDPSWYFKRIDTAKSVSNSSFTQTHKHAKLETIMMEMRGKNMNFR